jgi:hypothetical protein
MTGLIPRPGVLLPVLSPLDSCVLSARFQTVLGVSEVLRLPMSHHKKTLGFLILGSFEFVCYTFRRNRFPH